MLGEGLTHLRVQFGQLGQHAHRLRALTGEDKSEGGYGHAVIRLLQSKRAMIRGNMPCRLYVRVCTRMEAACRIGQRVMPPAAGTT